MAISLSGTPQDLTAGFNPVYIYASSTNATEPTFRYLVSITNDDTSTVLANVKVRPRYNDNLLEINVSKILGNNLGCFSDDIDFNSFVGGFNNTPSAGYQYSIGIGEEFSIPWEFGDVLFNSGAVRLTGATDSGYVYGDLINVSGAAEAFLFTDNQFDGGAVAFLVPAGHSINVGDTITVFQDEPYTFQQYNGNATVCATTVTTITTDKAFAGNTPVEGGVLYRNYPYDGLQLVTSAGTIGSNYYVDIDRSWINNSPTHTGSTAHYDGRVTQLPDSVTLEKSVFNGAVGHTAWSTWDSTVYSATTDTGKFLTTLPNAWTVRDDNDVFLNFWGQKVALANTFIRLKTYDASDSLIYSGDIINSDPLNQTEIMNASVGPRSLNNTPINVIENPYFATTSGWTLTAGGSATLVISGGTLNYYDLSGDEIGTAEQTGILTSGCTYTVTISVSDNNNIGIIAFAGGDSDLVVPYGDNGVFTTTLVADGTDFSLELASSASIESGVEINYVIVEGNCDSITCDVDHYTIQILNVLGGEQTEEFRFNLDCTCYKFQNYPLLFKDRFGSYVPFNFELNNKQKVNVNKRDAYKKFIGNGGATSYTYSANERSKSIYNIDIEEQWTLNTDWLTEAEAAYFEELITTPEASILIDGVYHAVMVTDKSYERLRKNNKKNIQYSINIMFANNNTINV